VVEKLCFAIKAGPLQIRRIGDNANIIVFKELSGMLRDSYRIRFMERYKRY
jgi:hypothetical protein